MIRLQRERLTSKSKSTSCPPKNAVYKGRGEKNAAFAELEEKKSTDGVIVIGDRVDFFPSKK